MPYNERGGMTREQRIITLLLFDRLYYFSVSNWRIADSYKDFEAGINEVDAWSSETVSVNLDICMACYPELFH